MDRRFLALTASLSALTFGGVWLAATPPGTSAAADLHALLPLSPAAESAVVYYPGCDAVRAAGKSPLFRDQPGYRPEMDGDGDGVACEVTVGHGGFSGGRGWRRSGRR
ncbi:excalibur calcium-binding domain-containing protein [Sphingomonas melonis]|uniref:excalibur calcium-binding domain-containing protein n=1 Tax=Sphingomonas melonis TaxID=152682 RepID=UPI0035C86DD8